MQVRSFFPYAAAVVFVVLLLSYVVWSQKDEQVVAEPARPQTETVPSASTRATEDLVLSCTTDMATTYHIHPTLSLVINGENINIPSGIGIEQGGCMHPIHTHETTGKIHIESPKPAEFHLSDFFLVWGKTYTKDQILDAKVDETHRIRMMVNGVESSDYENLILRDNDNILISYESK